MNAKPKYDRPHSANSSPVSRPDARPPLAVAAPQLQLAGLGHAVEWCRGAAHNTP